MTLYYSRKKAVRDTIHVVRYGRVLHLYDGKETSHLVPEN